MCIIRIIKKVMIVVIMAGVVVPVVSRGAALPSARAEEIPYVALAEAEEISVDEQRTLNAQLFDAVVSHRSSKKRMQLVLRQGADPNACYDFGYTALWPAACNAYLDKVQILIAAGADLNQKDEDGDTPLNVIIRGVICSSPCGDECLCFSPCKWCGRRYFSFCRCCNCFCYTPCPEYCLATDEYPQESRLAVIEELIKAGADLNVQDNHGQTALVNAVACSDVYIKHRAIQLLIAAGADEALLTNNGLTALSLARSWAPTAGDVRGLAFEPLTQALKDRDNLVETCRLEHEQGQPTKKFQGAYGYLLGVKDSDGPLPFSPLATIFIQYLPSYNPVAEAKQRAVYATERQRKRAEQTRARALEFRRREREEHASCGCCSVQ